MTATYCAPTPQAAGQLTDPRTIPVAPAVNMTAPTGLTAVPPAAFPLPCEPTP